ncbi:hypothetical protein EVAR_23413_1 [Eumeta japonica]|uniref:Uncharacterized protein n=1 Tax=Eumeta variegata TaxID=151549 RepID=A0A4C1VY89_EUMVA|nr:hypothetical protein EVAR_23413_1 [Eumeta japonica]
MGTEPGAFPFGCDAPQPMSHQRSYRPQIAHIRLIGFKPKERYADTVTRENLWSYWLTLFRNRLVHLVERPKGGSSRQTGQRDVGSNGR